MALAAALLALPAATAESCHLAAMELPVRMDGNRPIVTLGINGTQVPLLLDTGAFFSFLPMSTATQLHLQLRDAPRGLRVKGLTGDVDVRMTTVKTVEFQNHELSNVEFLVGGNELGPGIMGVMGRNFLSVADNEFDLAHGMVRLVVPEGDCKAANFAYWAGDAPVNVVPMLDTFVTHGSAMTVAVQINGHRFKALLDSGATTTLKRRAALRAGIEDAQMQLAGRLGGSGEGHAATWTAEVAQVAIGGETINHSVLLIDDAGGDSDMLLGIDWFLAHRIYVSRAQDKIYATWNGGPIFMHNRRAASEPQDEARYAAAPAAAPASDADALARSGEAAASRGDFKTALADLDRSCALAPTDAHCFAARAKVHLALNQPQAALADIEQALRLDPKDAATRLMRVHVRLHSLDDRAGALADLQSLDESLPNESQLRADVGAVYAEMDMAPEALHQWDLWMPTHQQDAARGKVLNQRCWMRVRMNVELDRALDDCRSAVSEDRGNAVYHESFGWLWMRRGQAGQAVAEFNQALALLPAMSRSMHGRGLARLASGDRAGGEADLAAARKLDPGVDDLARKSNLPTH